ncbi:hypothetical protein VIN01S_15750 [Vibrio inusitatus NBRC 102082]|uniref:histidine kinase n=1 Tax=Vibrio inusitatus NBRC 102082 TaxID=1219070 RepID=A0A4Y3HUW3_9VIBR|nr:sensor histidine kinase [Vibrio inusitatus]GEA50771.1 hypothetical protein VIN01S_15750 [Vibrio inusitatus NBRC 102082]
MNDILVGSWTVNSGGEFSAVSQLVFQILGLSPYSSITLADYVNKISSTDKDAYLTARQEAYKSGELKVEYEIIVGGTSKWIREVSLFSIDDINAHKPGNTRIQDITEFRLCENNKKECMDSAKEYVSSLLSIYEEERKRVAKDLHDDLSQRLAVVSIELGSTNEAGIIEIAKVRKIKADVVSISNDIHQLSRNLYPSVIEHFGLVDALRSEIDNFKKKEHIDVDFNTTIESLSIDRKTEIAIFRVLHEALSNIAKHSEAYVVSIELSEIEQSLVLQIKDNGIGFDVVEKLEAPGLGLTSMQARARFINGQLSIRSKEFQGVTIELRIPIS